MEDAGERGVCNARRMLDRVVENAVLSERELSAYAARNAVTERVGAREDSRTR
jgi:hypothetical protein